MSAAFRARRNSSYKPALKWLAVLAVVWTTFVFQAGGFTTSIEAGMAFLDWPLSNGSINPEGWLTEADKMAEHSHRLLATVQGLITLLLAAVLFAYEGRSWLRRLGATAVALVIFQGLLGGLRVLFDVQNTGGESNLVATIYRVAHGCAAQIYFCVMVAIAIGTTRTWIEHGGGLQRPPSARLQRLGLVACAVVIVQLVLGAIMRHNAAALAIWTFPLTPEGTLIPTHWDWRIGIHFAHRAWAIAVAIVLLWFTGRLWGSRHLGSVLGYGAMALTFLLGVQVYLGALVVWTGRNPHAATVHMLTGAFVLATCWSLTFLCHRFRFAETVAAVPQTRSSRADTEGTVVRT